MRRPSPPLTDSTCINHPIPSSINHQVDLWTSTYALRGAASAPPTCSMRSVTAPRLNTPSFVVGAERHDLAVVGRENRRSTVPTPPVNFWVYFDTAIALMRSRRHPSVHFTAG